MHIDQLLDKDLLRDHINEGLVEVRRCAFAPLDLYIHSRKAVLDQSWDHITENCRGLIVNRETGEVVSRPFRKFFNVGTSWRPETCVSNLPLTKPVVSEKLDGSLGILYTWEGKSYIATKGSFSSDQANWATRWYDLHCPNAVWPRGYTPIFEIIAESVQHHVVHYNGLEELVLLALIASSTGEERDTRQVEAWASSNGLRSAATYNKSLSEVLSEDRKNAEGYVLSWPRTGKEPLRVKVKHPGFLALQKIVHAVTPKAILEALQGGNNDLINTWIGQTNHQIGQWVQEWVAAFNGKYATILTKCKWATDAALYKSETRKQFALNTQQWSEHNDNVHPSVCFAMLDKKDHTQVIWKLVEKSFEKELGKAFALVEE